MIHFNIIVSFAPRSLPFRFPDYIFYHLSDACYMFILLILFDLIILIMLRKEYKVWSSSLRTLLRVYSSAPSVCVVTQQTFCFTQRVISPAFECAVSVGNYILGWRWSQDCVCASPAVRPANGPAGGRAGGPLNTWVGNETSVWEQMLIYLHCVIAFWRWSICMPMCVCPYLMYILGQRLKCDVIESYWNF
jgi:hypothetical protein